MNLEHVSAAIRPRGHWEAIDLGLRLVRPHYAQMLWTSLLVTAPIFVVTHLVLWNAMGLAPLVLWWLKPIWERPHLHLLSRQLFGEAPTVQETLRAFPSYGFRQWLPWLTVRRLSPTRSLDLPITQLEGLTGKERQRRIDLLHRGSTSSGAIWLTVVCAHLEGFLYLAIAVAVEFMSPEQLELGFSYWFNTGESPSRLHVLLLDVMLLGTSLLVAPFYVGGGFGLYINRRTILEGWDLEIAFRRMASRLRAPATRRAVAVASVASAATFVTVLAVATSPVRADLRPDLPGRALTLDQAREEVAEVLDTEVFHQKQTTRVPRFVLDWELEEEEADDPPAWLEAFRRALAAVAQSIAGMGRAILITLVVSLLAYAIYRTSKEPTEIRRRARLQSEAAPRVLLGFDVTPESLPDDVASAVLEAWQRGAAREALALLYRATLSEFANVHHVDFGVGFTERDCLAAVSRGASGERAEFFRELTERWQQLAYAHRSVSTAAVESLCVAWSSLFEEPVEPCAEGGRRG